MKNILSFLTVCFALGIIYVYYFRISFWPCYILAVALISACLLLINKKLIFDILFLILAFLLGALCLKNAYTANKSGISGYAYYKNDTIYTIKGFINSRPVFYDGSNSFIFRAEELGFDGNRYKTCGDILVYSNVQDKLFYGEELVLLGKLKKPHRLFKGRVPVIMRIRNSSALVRINKNKGNLIRKLAFSLKDRMEMVFKECLSSLSAIINNAMILGEKKRIPAVVYDSMVKSGTVHIMVVSGFHVGVVAFISGVSLKILRIPRKIRYGGIILCLIIYCLVTGVSTPVLRATVMGIFIATGYFMQRDSDITNSFFLAALFILIINPKDLFSISFQLSFASVVSIIYLYPFLKALFRIERIKIKFFKGIIEGGLVSFSAWLGTAGFIAYYFKIFSPVSVLANIFIIPVASLIILSGLSLVIISFILPPLTAAFAAFNEMSVFMLLKFNSFFINLPFAYIYL
ncbi:MAG: ComEC/Rec2 family competence protein [Candidatus Omnitrophica bacterium]|nr:ComEC/Rec2 family competence protein [Candidatus Omnitrophota bacterium]